MFSDKNNTSRTSGIGLAEVLFLIFLTLKLCGVIDWPWIWVLSPLWISLLLIGLVAVLFVVVKKIFDRKT